VSAAGRLAATAALGTLVALTAGCSGGGSGSGSSAAPMPRGAAAHDPTLLAGRKVFSAECASCHGSGGQGGAGPTFNDGRLLRDFPNPSDQVAFVEAGRGIMPAFSGILSRAQIESVVAYERAVLSARHPGG